MSAHALVYACLDASDVIDQLAISQEGGDGAEPWVTGARARLDNAVQLQVDHGLTHHTRYMRFEYALHANSSVCFFGSCTVTQIAQR